MHWLPARLYCLLTVRLITNQGMEDCRVFFWWGFFCTGKEAQKFSKRWHLFRHWQAVLVHKKKEQFSLFSLVGAHQKWKIKQTVLHLNSKASACFWRRGLLKIYFTFSSELEGLFFPPLLLKTSQKILFYVFVKHYNAAEKMITLNFI